MASTGRLRPAVAILSINHIVNDTYSNYLPQFLPFLVAATGISVAKATALVSVFTVSSAVMQPVFGYLADKKRQSLWIYTGTLWMAAALSLTGVFHDFGPLLLLAAAAGIGTAAFHPQAYSIVSGTAGDRRGAAVSAFMSVGHLGWAISPLVFIPFFSAFGIAKSVYIVVPAVVMTVTLALRLRGETGITEADEESPLDLNQVLPQSALLLLLVSLCSLVYTGLTALLPLYFKSDPLYSGHISILLFGFFAAGALGQIAAGNLSDQFGRRPVIFWSSLLSPPLLLGFLLLKNFPGYALLLLGSMTFMAVFPVSLVLAHEMLPGNAAIASGIFNGLGIGIGAAAAVLAGVIADLYGLKTALTAVSAMPLAAGLLALKIRKTE